MDLAPATIKNSSKQALAILQRCHRANGARDDVAYDDGDVDPELRRDERSVAREKWCRAIDHEDFKRVTTAISFMVQYRPRVEHFAPLMKPTAVSLQESCPPVRIFYFPHLLAVCGTPHREQQSRICLFWPGTSTARAWFSPQACQVANSARARVMVTISAAFPPKRDLVTILQNARRSAAQLAAFLPP